MYYIYCIIYRRRGSVRRSPTQVSILASHGDRPRGSMYLLARPPRDGTVHSIIGEIGSEYPSGASHSTAEDENSGSVVVVEGLALEEEEGSSDGGVVRVIGPSPPAAAGGGGGIFSGMTFNKGDRIYGVNGRDVSSIEDLIAALSSSRIDAAATTTTTTTTSSLLIPVLTYNPYRRVRSALMTVTLSNAFARGGLKLDVGGGSGTAEEGKPMVRIDDTYAIGEKVRNRIRLFCTFVSHSICRECERKRERE